MDEHKISIAALYKRLQTGPEGLSSSEAAKRLENSGHNELAAKKETPAIVKFLSQFKNFFAILLIVGACLAFVAERISPGEGNLYIGIALAGVVVLNALFTFFQEYKNEKILESFKKMLPHMVAVVREGVRQKIPAKELVPGDIIYLEEGDKIPADGRLIDENGLKVDNSSITGESEPQLRKLECTHSNILESRNMVFSATTVQVGNGTAVVYATGMNTEIGKIVNLTKQTEQTSSPLRKEIRHFVSIISAIAIGLGLLFFMVSLLLGQPLIGSVIFAIGIIVANVPEGLLPTVTLSLSIAAKKMSKKNALIKNLESVETLGSTTVICTDKTGTITQNLMSVNTLLLGFDELNALDKDIKKHGNLDMISKTAFYCNNAKIGKSGGIGDPTEIALLEFSNRFVSKNCERMHESPFDSKTKRMITTNKDNGKLTSYMKGAPEIILKKCSHFLANGKKKALNDAEIKTLVDAYKLIASRGERVLGFAYKDSNTIHPDEKNFVFLGLIGMIDPPRREVAESIQKCQTAGIRVIMITGDYSLTAEAIAKKVGIIDPDKKSIIIEGTELAKMNDQKLKKLVKQENLIFARTNPAQKLRIVQALQSNGEVVTVTGDGVNDAPALKNADMGVAMGQSGTEVAREASDMVLLDDNFASIVNAVEEGRTIFENIKKFIAYILTSNIPEILPFIAFVLLGIPLPLTVVLILAIDLGTDLLPGIGLGMEKPESDVMKKKPRDRKERLLTRKLLFMSYGIVGMLQAAAGFFAYFMVLFNGGWQWGQELLSSDLLYRQAITAFFVSIIICQIADVLICKTRRESAFKAGIFSNRVILYGIAVELLLAAFIVYAPIGHTIFGTASLGLKDLLWSVPFALLIFFGDEVRKIFARKENKFVLKYLTW